MGGDGYAPRLGEGSDPTRHGGRRRVIALGLCMTLLAGLLAIVDSQPVGAQPTSWQVVLSRSSIVPVVGETVTATLVVDGEMCAWDESEDEWVEVEGCWHPTGDFYLDRNWDTNTPRATGFIGPDGDRFDVFFGQQCPARPASLAPPPARSGSTPSSRSRAGSRAAPASA